MADISGAMCTHADTRHRTGVSEKSARFSGTVDGDGVLERDQPAKLQAQLLELIIVVSFDSVAFIDSVNHKERVAFICFLFNFRFVCKTWNSAVHTWVGIECPIERVFENIPLRFKPMTYSVFLKNASNVYDSIRERSVTSPHMFMLTWIAKFGVEVSFGTTLKQFEPCSEFYIVNGRKPPDEILRLHSLDPRLRRSSVSKIEVRHCVDLSSLSTHVKRTMNRVALTIEVKTFHSADNVEKCGVLYISAHTHGHTSWRTTSTPPTAPHYVCLDEGRIDVVSQGATRDNDKNLLVSVTTNKNTGDPRKKSGQFAFSEHHWDRPPPSIADETDMTTTRMLDADADCRYFVLSFDCFDERHDCVHKVTIR